MAIVKTVFQVIVLHEKGNDITKHDLPYILEEMDTGDCLGQVRHIHSTVIPTRDAVIAEMHAVGNDGTFFEVDDYKN